ncbi:uncharacterized protein L969DRAFT_21930 [Mixia osmundae IAM 14324]|uniref:Large ribosomal subunit protein uL14m n=1 Tax=Mixia osmundae (strain CBS 9802 / IAM 14324 / JCM 22182 / KY 12970) TaxID=764103 RepID=G7DXD0_MIXOS|nr:uncharacterized protein L969DRAFT_21930 [Mixia osmundae IAM 14324]KEI41266.1 hypothetical protein L969DRAFT_21930 [Mixia osmundae IAM 14324]GAA95240.1 hypothetical protein E5Q_01896 [Mixia osmundae IAM 14324]
MLGLKATFNAIDNSGAIICEVVNVLKHKSNHGFARVGDEVVCVVKKARPIPAALTTTQAANKVRRGDVRRAVIVRTRKEAKRSDGSVLRFDDNAGVLINNRKELLGTRITGVVAAELKHKGWARIVALAEKIV